MVDENRYLRYSFELTHPNPVIPLVQKSFLLVITSFRFRYLRPLLPWRVIYLFDLLYLASAVDDLALDL